ncbi:MAG: hypothetical protein ACOZNI_24140 [Myxococcota bacterium]
MVHVGALLLALSARAATLALDAPERVLARCDEGDAAACLELGDAAEWAWANSVAVGAPEPQREAQALAAWHEACRLDLTVACERVEAVRRARSGDDDDGSCERGWAPGCAVLSLERRARVCSWAPDPASHPACTQLPLRLVGMVADVRAIEAWGVQTKAGAWFGEAEERWGAGAEPVGGHGGELWWLRDDGTTQTLLRLSPNGLVELPAGADADTFHHHGVPGSDALFVEARSSGGVARPALAPLDGGPLVPLGRRPAGPGAVSAKRMAWLEGGTPTGDATVVWGTIAGVAEGKVTGRDPMISPDGRRLLLSRGADVVLVDLATRAERRVGEGRAMAWGPDGSWFVTSGPAVTRVTHVSGKELARFSGPVEEVATGPGLVWLDDALFELEPNAWAPRAPSRDGALPLSRAMLGSPTAYPDPRGVDVEIRIQTCDGTSADGFLVARAGWSGEVRGGRVTVPASAAGHDADVIVGGGAYAPGAVVVVGPTDAAPLDFRASPQRWGGRGAVTLSLTCRRALSAADARDPRALTAWGWRGRQLRGSVVLAAVIPWPFVTSTPGDARAGPYEPILTHDESGWFGTSVEVTAEGVLVRHDALPTHVLRLRDAAGVPYAGARAWVTLGELGGEWASADLRGELTLPEGATVELAGHPKLVDPRDEVVVGDAAPTPARSTTRPSGTWARDPGAHPKLPLSLSAAELAPFTPVQVNATTVVTRYREGTVVWRSPGG